MHQQQDSIVLGRRPVQPVPPRARRLSLVVRARQWGGGKGEVWVWSGPYLIEGCGGELRRVSVEGQARDALVVRRVDLAQRLAARQLEHL